MIVHCSSNLIVDAQFCESISKNPWGRKPNEKQGLKTHQEDWRARNVQRKKCKGEQSTAKRKSAAEYISAVEYRSAVEYSSLVEWLWQIKTNWALDPFDPVNIIWPTKTQILLYKRTGVKTNMKKYDEKKQGTTWSVSNRKCVKKRKVKLKEMTNTAGNAWRNKTKTCNRTKQN